MDTETLASASAVFAVLFSYYVRTAYPSVPGGDSGELLAEACTLGVAHPPGYPLFIYFARACMELLPASLGSPAYRVNLGCCALGALAGSLLHCFTVLQARRVAAGGAALLPSWALQPLCASAAVLWGLSPLIWLYHTGAEVFALSNFFVAALLLAGALFAQRVQASAAAAAQAQASHAAALRSVLSGAHWLALLCGLALTNQHTALLLVVPLAAFTAATLAPLLPLQEAQGAPPSCTLALLRTASLTGAGALGLLPYLHLPLAHTLWRSPGSWGDASTLQGLLRHFLRSDYGTFRLMGRDGQAEGLAERTVAHARDFATLQLPHWLWAGAVLLGLLGAALTMAAPALAALAALAAACRPAVKPAKPAAKGAPAEVAVAAAAAAAAPCPLAAALAASAVVASTAPAALLPLSLGFYFLVFHGLSNMPLTDPLLYAVHARFWLHPNTLLFPCAPLGAVLLACRLLPAASPRTPLLPQATLLALTLLSLTAVATQQARNYAALDNSANTVIARYGRALLAPLPPNATLLTAYDFQWTSTRYLQSCEGARPDVALLNAPVMSYAWFAAQRALYPALAFPGTHLTPAFTAPHAAGGFSFTDFALANAQAGGAGALLSSYAEDPPHPSFVPRAVVGSSSSGSSSGGIFYTGSQLGSGGGGSSEGGSTASATSEASFLRAFEAHPHGATTRAVPRSPAPVTHWRALHTPAEQAQQQALPPPRRATPAEVAAARAAWRTAFAHFDGAVNSTVHDASTWEQATRLDFWSSAQVHATWLLEWATSSPGGALHTPAIAAAACLLERVVVEGGRHAGAVGGGSAAERDPNLIKNLGLAYVHLVREPSPLLQQQQQQREEGWEEGGLGLEGDAQGLPVLPVLRARALQSGLEEGGVSQGPGFGLRRGLVSEAQWKTLAAERVLETWGAYLKTSAAKADTGRAHIEMVVKVLREAASKGKEQKTK